jgi:hypothetical protein
LEVAVGNVASGHFAGGSMSNRPSNDRNDDAGSVNPADRDEQDSIDRNLEPADDSQRASMHNTQSEQNQDMNKHYDPSQGKRRDQLRRNDKQGQMGG